MMDNNFYEMEDRQEREVFFVIFFILTNLF